MPYNRKERNEKPSFLKKFKKMVWPHDCPKRKPLGNGIIEQMNNTQVVHYEQLRAKLSCFDGKDRVIDANRITQITVDVNGNLKVLAEKLNARTQRACFYCTSVSFFSDGFGIYYGK